MSAVLAARDLVVHYGSFEALKGVSFSVEAGAIGLLGPNGAGKSTLIKAILNLVPVHSGGITLMGRPSTSVGAALRDDIGYVPEREGVRPGLNGVAWVALLGQLSGLPRKAAVERAHEVLQYVKLEGSRYRNVETYSTGMRQRLKLAAALVHDPDLLLLDEPTAGMDPVGREEMLELCQDLVRHGKTILLSTHILKDVEALCDKVLILHKGEMLAGATVEDWTRSEAQHYLVQWEGPRGVFPGACKQAGWSVEERKDGLYKLVLPADVSLRSVFGVAKSAGGILSRIIREATSLEELFLSTLQKNGEAHAGL